jgi:hypothetical protein
MAKKNLLGDKEYERPSLTGLAVGLDQETTPLMSPPVDKECVEQVYKYESDQTE